MRFGLIITFIIFGGFTAVAQNLNNVELEKRAQIVGRALRCVVCQGESIEESGADLAADMRRVVREHIGKGESNEQVMSFMRDRYGDYVLLKPPVQKNTWILWFGPFGAIALAFFIYFFRARQKNGVVVETPLSDDEQKRLRALAKSANAGDDQ